MIAACRQRPANGLAIGVLPRIAVQFAPLPGLVITAQLTVASVDRRRQAAGEYHGLVFFLRRAKVIPERTVLALQQMIGLRRVGQFAVSDKRFPRRAGFRTEFVEEDLFHAFLQEQFIDRRISRSRAEFAVERHQPRERLTRLAAIGFRQRINRLFQRLLHAWRVKDFLQFGGECCGLVVLHGDHAAAVVLAAAGQFCQTLAAFRCSPGVG